MQFAHYRYLCEHMFELNAAGVVKQHYGKMEVEKLSPLILAYIGDAYFHLFVRTRMLFFEQNKVRVLNDFSAKIVSAVYQAEAYRQIEKQLTESEKNLFHRAYSAKSHAPRAASVADYHTSTGFEAVLGYLYLTGNKIRLQEICEKSFQSIIKTIHNEHTDN
nr:ribonuclease III domain-containing protein [Pectinatus frisingensis]